MKVKEGEKILVVRFSNMYGEDSIEKHNEVSDYIVTHQIHKKIWHR